MVEPVKPKRDTASGIWSGADYAISPTSGDFVATETFSLRLLAISSSGLQWARHALAVAGCNVIMQHGDIRV